MKYKLYKLTFYNSVHFGGETPGTSLEEAEYICHSDTFFSALCLEYIKLYGEEALYDNFIKLFEDRELLISSLFPYKDDDIYIPKPLYLYQNNKVSNINKVKDRKKMKKLSFIKLNDIDNYINSIKNHNDFDYDDSYNKFACYSLIQKVGLRDEDGDNSLYSVGSYFFEKNCGLYFILVYNNDEHLDRFNFIMKSLSYSGLGGKRNLGYGGFKDNFDFDKDYSYIKDILLKTNSNCKMLLSLYSPYNEEIEELNLTDSYYSLLKRNGFVYSSSYSSSLLKRNSICMFKEGSCFKDDLNGEIKDVSNGGNHNVYKYGKALYIGIDV